MVGILRWKLIRKDKTQETTTTNSFLKHGIAGGIAGGLSRTITAPFDRMKVYSQVHKENLTLRQVITRMIDEGGFFGLWRGNLVNVVKTIPKSALRFSVYDKTKRILLGDKPKTKELTRMKKITAGSVAGAVTQTLTYPLDVLKVRMSLRKTDQYRGIVDAMVQIRKREGIAAFYKGFFFNLVSSVPYSGLDLGGYEITKREYSKMKGRNLLGYELFIVSAFSAFVSQTTTYPLVVVVTRMQASTTGKEGAAQIFLDIYKQEGLYGYYKGLLPSLIKLIPTMAITYYTYENIILLLDTSMSPPD